MDANTVFFQKTEHNFVGQKKDIIFASLFEGKHIYKEYNNMSRICQLTGKKAMKGNSVSFSNSKTRRQFKVNLKTKKFFVPETGEWVTLRVSTSAIKNINKKGIFACLKDAVESGILA